MNDKEKSEFIKTYKNPSLSFAETLEGFIAKGILPQGYSHSDFMHMTYY